MSHCTEQTVTVSRPVSNKAVKGVSKRGLRQIHRNAAGIDVGSTEHYVAVPEDRSDTPVRVFGCTTPDLHAMARWLAECSIDKIAMESTGVYWIPVVQVLEQYGLKVIVVDAHYIKNVPGRKSDVVDCQWIQELHTFGLLRGAFRPDRNIRTLRSYWRHREGLVQSCAQQIHLMHKALEQMNLQLHKVLSDVTGLTGMKIIRAIVDGERNAVELARMKHPLVKSSEEDLVKALTGEYCPEHLFALRHAVELYDVFQTKLGECDREMEKYMATLESKANPKDLGGKRTQKRRKNQAHFDLRKELFRLSGVDLTRIDGIDALTAQTIICECGFDLSAFPTEKHFASWLGLCPNNRITGGRVRNTRTRKVQNRAATALRIAAQSLHRSHSALGAFLRRLKARLGAPKAITAAAHKLARLVYRMLKYGMVYVDKGQDYYEQQHQQRVLKNLAKRAKQMGYQLIRPQTAELVS